MPLEGAPVQLTDSTDFLPLGPYLEIMEDPAGKTTIQEILEGDKAGFTPASKDVPYFAFTESAYWVKFSLQNNSRNDDSWLIELEYPLMDHIDYYLVMKGSVKESITSGYRVPFLQRPLNNRHFLFPLKLEKGEEATVYLRFANRDRMEIPLRIWSIREFYRQDHDEQYIMGAYAGILIFMIIFNFLIFLQIRDISYLYYVLFMFSYAFFQLTQNGFMYEYYMPTWLQPYNHNIPLSIGLTLITLLLFSRSFLNTATNFPLINRIFIALMGITFLTLPAQFLLSYPVSIQIQLVLSLLVISMVLFTGTISLIRRYRPARFFMIAWSAMLLGGMIYAFKVAGILPSNFFVNYALQLGSLVNFVTLSFGLGDRINIMRKEKEEASSRAKLSEERYKSLVEQADDLIFTMDENWNFITVNKAIRSLFRVQPENLRGQNIVRLIHDEEGDYMTRQLVSEKLENFAQDREPVTFRAPFKSPFTDEPKDMEVRLEYINIEGRNEILGTASPVTDDALIECFRSEQQTYEMGNYLLVADDLTHRITRNLNRYLDPRQSNMVRLALREIIINAIEHGNLCITYEEKSQALTDNTYFEFIARRQKNEKYSARKVYITYSINANRAVYRVTDDGEGFDYKSIISDDSDRANREMQSHGRGLSMAKNIFDSMDFNQKGNQVTLTKFFPGG
jgi:PAS domain S-box-containing protein